MWSDTTARKLASLIPRLASDQAGEVAATAAAIGRLLSREGKDWHDLAKAATNNAPHASSGTQWRREPEPPPRTEWQDKADFCVEMAAHLTGRESEFVHDMQAKLKWLDQPSPKQAAWLDSIYSRLRRYKDAGNF